ncbi:PIG-L family deacetylase [Candidatus Shapirobacteria bacterium]|nr:PIG-L family deacetylase [Candidatus Shapirobacteria bacterium]
MTNITDSYSQIFANKQRIMAVFAHPDDLELYCGGTVSRLIADGKTVRSVKMTSGDMGSRQEKITQTELKIIREQEDSASMSKLGILPENNIYLRLPDGQVENDLETIGLLAQQIRLFQPDLIITHNSEDSIIRFDKDINWFNHRDHRHTGQLVLDGSYPYARDLLFFPEHFTNPLAKSWTCTEFLIVDSYSHIDSLFIDITDHLARRVEAHSQHKSQYTVNAAQDSADFFTSSWDPTGQKKYETFRYVKAD